MLPTRAFVDELSWLGYSFFTGVPCSYLTPLLNEIANRRKTDYVISNNEGEAVGIAAGAWLAGRKTVVFCQNSGVGNMVNPLTSLNAAFQIPALLLVTWRGEPGLKDEPQHKLMGEILPSLLDGLRIEKAFLPKDMREARIAIKTAAQTVECTSLPFALIASRDTFEETALREPASVQLFVGTQEDVRSSSKPPVRMAALERILAAAPPEAALISTTGKCSRELFTLADRRQHLYVVGSMGCASAIGLGVAVNTARPVIVIDGDAAALMRLGNFATIGAHRPRNLVHILLDNGVNDSTGGQRTAADSTNFGAVAHACGYSHAIACNDLAAFEGAVRAALARQGPSFVHMKIAPGSSPDLGRPAVGPIEVGRRFSNFVRSGSREAEKSDSPRLAEGVHVPLQ
jgi:phosphonopyruvate decarboxylase